MVVAALLLGLLPAAARAQNDGADEAAAAEAAGVPPVGPDGRHPHVTRLSALLAAADDEAPRVELAGATLVDPGLADAGRAQLRVTLAGDAPRWLLIDAGALLVTDSGSAFVPRPDQRRLVAPPGGVVEIEVLPMAPEQPDAAPGVALTLQALDSPALLTLLRTLQSIEAEDAPRLARHLTPQGDGYAVETGVRNRDAKLAAWMDWRKGPDGQPRGRFPVDPVRFALYAVTADYILDTVVNWMRVQRSLDLDPAVQAAWAIAEPTEYLLERAGFEFRIFSPRHAEYHANHGVALFNVGDLEGAEKACRIAIQKRPELVEAHAGLGVVLYRAGKYEDAANALLIASGIEGASADVFFNRAATLYRTGDLMGAARALRGVLSRTPDDADAEAWLAKADPEGKTAPPPPPPKPAPRSRSRRRR